MPSLPVLLLAASIFLSANHVLGSSPDWEMSYGYTRHGEDWIDGDCAARESQSPIDFDHDAPWDCDPSLSYHQHCAKKPFHHEYQPLDVISLVNTGHALVLQLGENGYGGVWIENEYFSVVYAKVHTRSEHTFWRRRLPMELQLYHKHTHHEEILAISIPFDTPGGEDDDEDEPEHEDDVKLLTQTSRLRGNRHHKKDVEKLIAGKNKAPSAVAKHMVATQHKLSGTKASRTNATAARRNAAPKHRVLSQSGARRHTATIQRHSATASHHQQSRTGASHSHGSNASQAWHRKHLGPLAKILRQAHPGRHLSRAASNLLNLVRREDEEELPTEEDAEDVVEETAEEALEDAAEELTGEVTAADDEAAQLEAEEKAAAEAAAEEAEAAREPTEEEVNEEDEEGFSNILAGLLPTKLLPEDGKIMQLQLAEETDLLSPLLDDGIFFEYQGSLTEPPCSEQVRWLVRANPLVASRHQLAAIRRAVMEANDHLENWRGVMPPWVRPIYMRTTKKGREDPEEETDGKDVVGRQVHNPLRAVSVAKHALKFGIDTHKRARKLGIAVKEASEAESPVPQPYPEDVKVLPELADMMASFPKGLPTHNDYDLMRT